MLYVLPIHGSRKSDTSGLPVSSFNVKPTSVPANGGAVEQMTRTSLDRASFQPRQTANGNQPMNRSGKHSPFNAARSNRTRMFRGDHAYVRSTCTPAGT